MADDDIKHIPIKDLRQEPGAHELASSPDMKPYLEFIKAVMHDHDPSPELEAIRQLPLEKRYSWRIASALKWGFADFDDLSVDADKKDADARGFGQVDGSPEAALGPVLHFPKILIGAEEMKRITVQAIGVAKQQN